LLTAARILCLIPFLSQNPPFVAGRKTLPPQGFGGEWEVLFDTFSGVKKYDFWRRASGVEAVGALCREEET